MAQESNISHSGTRVDDVRDWLTRKVATVSGVDPAQVDPTVSFDSYGITSTDAVGISGELEVLLGVALSPTLLYEHSSINQLATHLVGQGQPDAETPDLLAAAEDDDDPICVVGMACRFPGAADNPETFWRNLTDGLDAATEVPSDRWDAAAHYSADPDAPGTAYTTLGGFIRDLAGFDAAFFDISPREALRMDPQQRILLEVAWQALENAGIAPDRIRGSRTGVFVGQMVSSQYANLQTDGGTGCLDDPYFGIGSSSSVVAGRLSYLLDLRGPSLLVDTACSSSMVALHLAANSLRRGESELALVGGVSATMHPDVFRQGSKMRMLATDGKCKTFDATADGFLMGEGCGVVVVERMSRAVANGHRVLAVLRGSAVNQDGASNGLTAPNGAAQVSVIRAALAAAGRSPAAVDFVEAHGSGTLLGDSIEMASLHDVFRLDRRADHPLVVGAVKTNVGHLVGAAGMAGLIKTVLAVGHRQIPANLHLAEVNPTVDWDRCPVLLPDSLIPWPSSTDGQGDAAPRRRALAGVSSFGWSGTNAHVIIEEPPEPARVPQDEAPSWQAVLLSARTESALSAVAGNLRDHLAANPDASLADLAFTTQFGRSALDYRTAVTCHDVPDAVAALDRVATEPTPRHVPRGRDVPVSLLLPGSGEHYVGMGRDLYESEGAFRAAIDECAEIAVELLGLDLRTVLYPATSERGDVDGPNLLAMLGRDTGRRPGDEPAPLDRLDVAHVAVFAVDYACAQLWSHRGVRPVALLGYSLGEYVAACLAGVYSLRDGLKVVARRAQLVASMPAGAMVAVGLPAEKISAYLGDEWSLAAINGPLTSVLAGPREAVPELRRRLDADEVAHRRIATSHAMHSRMLDPLRAAVVELFASIELGDPTVAFLSNVTGTWITAGQARDPEYWAAHLCQTVLFSAGVEELVAEHPGVLLEAGPGQLSSLAAQVIAGGRGDRSGTPTSVTVPTIRAAGDTSDDRRILLRSAGRLWTHGVPVEWPAAHDGRQRRIVPLPAYPFEHQRFWPAAAKPATPLARRAAINDWLYAPAWKPTPVGSAATLAGPLLVLADQLGVSDLLGSQLSDVDEIVTVRPADRFAQTGARSFEIRPGDLDDYRLLFERLAEDGLVPRTVVHLWSITGAGTSGSPLDATRRQQELGFYSLAYLGHVFGSSTVDGGRILVVTDGAQAVDPAEPLQPGKATIFGPCHTLPQEYPGLAVRTVDLAVGAVTGSPDATTLLRAELDWPGQETVIAHRSGRRWVRHYVRVRPTDPAPTVLRDDGVYLITGGLGNLGLRIAGHIAGRVRARLVLVGRHGLPPRAEWDALLDSGLDDDAMTGRIRKVRQLEAAGAHVLVHAADVADPPAMANLMAIVREHFGPINGVVHAAGLIDPDSFVALQDLTPEHAEPHLAAKVYGTIALAEALAGEALDFCLLQSSMSALLGGIRFTAYAAANSFLDSFAQEHNRTSNQPWRSVAWDTWQSTVDELSDSDAGATMVEFSMTSEEGLAVFDQVLAHPSRQLVVSVGDLAERIADWVQPTDSFAENVSAPDEAMFPRPQLVEVFVSARTDYERRLEVLWRRALGIEDIGVNDNFFELGGNSLVGTQLVGSIKKEFRRSIPMVALFEAPTVRAMARYLMPDGEEDPAPTTAVVTPGAAGDDIAIIGMAGRFPGAGSVEQLWDNLRGGVESIRFFTEDELIEAGVPAELVRRPNYVKARPILDNVESFDADFFGYTPWEARITDPQQRIFLECCWEALEAAGYAPASHAGRTAVFGGANISTYLSRLYEDPAIAGSINDYQVVISNDKDALTTNVSYRLNLSGPSLAVQTFCSTSLVATHIACQSILAGDCDMALAGGVSVRVPDRMGHLFEPGGMETPDGHVRTFDKDARGALFGDGAAVVLLKPLAAALADGDPVAAVIKGSAINNDGSLKVGFTAPSVTGQAAVVAHALRTAGVDPATVSYVEAHGTATELGDPIEVTALTRAFGNTPERQSCVIGSVKTNVGHLDRAAGVTGLIKTVLSLQHQQLPANLHFREANPEIDFENSPFRVNSELSDWRGDGDQPRRAGVNSLGMGGTNAHVVLEEAPPVRTPSTGRDRQLVVLSARNQAALDEQTANLVRHLREHPETPLPDLSYTLQVGRERFEYRRALVCGSTEDALRLLDERHPVQVLDRRDKTTERPIGYVFAGVGEQYQGMAAGLYRTEAEFRRVIDECSAEFLELSGVDLGELLCADESADAGSPSLLAMLGRAEQAEPTTAARELTRTVIAQPAVFVLEYALARLLISWGLLPDAMVGYSLGEYVAACVAGVLSQQDALRLVAERARLIDELPAGAMLAVSASAEQLAARMGPELDIAVDNGPGSCVVAGPRAAVEELRAGLAEDGVPARVLETNHAFHSRMMDPVAEPLTSWIRDNVSLGTPRVPYLSNVTGTWITAEQATDPAYWARHMREPVRFGDAIGELLVERERLLVEIGPGRSLGSIIRQHPGCDRERNAFIVPSLPARHERTDSESTVHAAIAKLWLLGAAVDWPSYHRGELRNRVPLPTYPFQRQRFWIDTDAARPGAGGTLGNQFATPAQALTALPRNEVDKWFYAPAWSQAVAPAATVPVDGVWLVLAGAGGLAESLIQEIRHAGGEVVVVRAGESFARTGADTFTLDPSCRADYTALLRELHDSGLDVRNVVQLWNTDDVVPASGGPAADRSFFSLTRLAQALGEETVEPCEIHVITASAFNVTGAEPVDPAKAMVLGPCKVIPLEYPTLSCRHIDVLASADPRTTAAELVRELGGGSAEASVALRGRRRWTLRYERIELPPAPEPREVLREGGVYLITGGLGGIGMAMARGLAAGVHARLVLAGRSGLPSADLWDGLLADPDTPPELIRRVSDVRELIASGAEVLVVAADVGNRDDVRLLLKTVDETFGRLDGVIHAAGLPGMGLMQFKTDTAVGKVLAPKVLGARVLRDCLAGRSLDFLALFSSTAAITGGGPGQSDYSAANAYLDAVAQAADGGSYRTLAINWGEWRWNAWDLALAGLDELSTEFLRQNRERIGITFEEGWQAFLRAMSTEERQLVVCSQDISELVEITGLFSLSSMETLGHERQADGIRHPRPDLSVPYVEPDNDRTRELAGIWQDSLGLAEVGLHDDFFELGGNSLLAISLVARMRRALDCEWLPTHVLYETPTVAAVATLLDEQGPEDESGEARRRRGAERRESLGRGAMR